MPPPATDRDAESEARRKRKRENDRKAQRVARERSKKRIEHLEFLLGNLRKDEQHDDSTELADRLEKATNERDALLDSLRSIEALVQRQISRHSDIGGPSSSRQAPAAAVDDHPDVKPPPRPPAPPSQSIPVPGPSSPGASSSASSAGEAVKQPISSLDVMPGSALPPMPEDCMWSVAKQTLRKPHVFCPLDLAQWQDVPVRAAIEGWEAVERAGRMSPFWAMLRGLDEQCLAACGPVERIGFLYMMHTLMTYHGDPTQKNFENLPPFYWMRPSQSLPHAYAADFFPWPGVRERFVFSEARYANEDFSILFPSQLQVAWPYDLYDIFTISPETNTYAVTPLFDRHIRNIQVWTMRPDFFQRFPELMSDIPVAGSIPGAIDWHGPPPRRPRVKDENGGEGSSRQVSRYPPWSPRFARKRQRSLTLLGAPPSPDGREQRRQKHEIEA
ncbi:hypothetical protein F5X68DRAFT_276850 [Plectosphaerella plurivora]|uniref:BZIP domain-containing protein n=1 Tax=Plectosphaerella plurivora TaxID=936078 RepID=A0A9P8V9K9_9PEZI|nr:hypothetical protein F5X68DRAFT_276850 [Plectosphaerella plurivora]